MVVVNKVLVQLVGDNVGKPHIGWPRKNAYFGIYLKFIGCHIC
jgi:hypothetical protein